MTRKKQKAQPRPQPRAESNKDPHQYRGRNGDVPETVTEPQEAPPGEYMQFETGPGVPPSQNRMR